MRKIRKQRLKTILKLALNLLFELTKISPLKQMEPIPSTSRACDEVTPSTSQSKYLKKVVNRINETTKVKKTIPTDPRPFIQRGGRFTMNTASSAPSKLNQNVKRPLSESQSSDER